MIRPAPAERILLTPAQVAALFGVDVKTVYRWSRAGRLTAYRRGHDVRFAEHEVRALYAWTPS